jgi:hypothetical protein
MAAVYSKQYRPASTRETAALDGLSVRFMRDAETALNNYKAYVGAGKIVSEWAIPSTKFLSPGSSTQEQVIAVWAPRRIPDGYTRIFWQICGSRRSGSSSTTWRLYSSPIQYRGPLVMAASSYLSQGYGVDDLTISSSSNEIVQSGDLEIARDVYDDTWLILTAANGDASTQSGLITIDVTPVLS